MSECFPVAVEISLALTMPNIHQNTSIPKNVSASGSNKYQRLSLAEKSLWHFHVFTI